MTAARSSRTRGLLRLALLLAAASLPAAAPLPAAAQQPRLTVSGTVTDAVSSLPVAGATVELDGFGDRVTNARGVFLFRDVPAGPHRLTVRLLGYRTHDANVVLRADTTLAITLQVDAVLLDSIRARARDVDVRGKVRQAGSDHGIPDATVMVGSKTPVTSNLRGDFRVRDLPEGVATVVQIGALGYGPANFTILPTRGRKLDVELVHDPIGQRMIAEQVARIETRARAVAKPLIVLNREQLDKDYGWPVDLALRSRFGRRVRPSCVIIDEVSFERLRMPGESAMQLIATYLTQEIERIEIFEGGRMLRLYTRSFIRSMMAGDVPSLASIRLDMPMNLACM